MRKGGGKWWNAIVLLRCDIVSVGECTERKRRAAAGFVGVLVLFWRERSR